MSPPYTTEEALIHHACEQAIRSRVRDLAENADQDAADRLSAKRTSLDLLHLAFQEDRLDGLQVRLLERLLDTYEHMIDQRARPFWPGAEAQFLRQTADEKTAIAVARAHLHAQL